MMQKTKGVLRPVMIGMIAACVAWYSYPALAQKPPVLWDGWPPYTFRADSVVITMERTGCLGYCPVYSVIIRGDGRGLYHGKKHVNVVGERAFKVDPHAVIALLNEFYRLWVFDLNESYDSERHITLESDGTVRTSVVYTSDGSGTVVTVRVGGCQKRVRSVWNSPAEIQTLVDGIEALAGSDRWVRGIAVPDTTDGGE